MRNKFVLIAIVSVILFAVLTVVIPLALPTSFYRGWFESKISGQLNARISAGKISFQLIPYPKYTIYDFDLVSTEAPFQGLPLFSAKKITGDLSLLGILKGKIVTQPKAEKAIIDYRMAEGRTNVGMVFGFLNNTVLGAQPTLVPSDATILSGKALEGAKGSFPEEPPSTPPAEGVSPPPAAMPAQPEASPPAAAPTVPPPEPQSLKFIEGLFVKDLFAKETKDGGLAGEGISLRSMDLSRSRINVWESGAVAFFIDNVEMSAKKLAIAGGMGADLKMTGVASEPVSTAVTPDARGFKTNIGIAGQVFFDAARKEIASRGLRANLGGAQVSSDFSINYGAIPISFDIHVASPDLNFNAASPLFSILPAASALPAWEGPVSADILLKGTREASEVSIQIDATTARILAGMSRRSDTDPSQGAFFVKGAGLSFKAALSVMASQTLISVREGTITIGQDLYSLGAEIGRDENSTAQISFSGKGLSDSAIRVFFPRALAFDEFSDLEIAVNAEGQLKGPDPMKLAGTFKAGKLSIAGIGLTGAEGSFEREIVPAEARAAPAGEPSPSGFDSIFKIPLFRATFFGGSISGNGSISLDSNVSFNFDAVGEHIDAAQIPTVAGLLAGEASIVVKAMGQGVDSSSLANSLSLAGSFLMPDGAFVGAKPAAQILSSDMWKWLGEQSKAVLLPAIVEKLSNPSDEAVSFNATFELGKNLLKLSEISWSNPQYDAKFTATIDPLRSIGGEGSITIPNAIATALVPVASQRILLDGDGRLVLPIVLSGKLAELDAKVDRTKLGAQIDAALAAAPPLPAKPSKEGAKPAKQAAREDGKVQAQEPASKATPKAAPKGEGRPTPKKEKPIPKQSEEDVLNVIIGQ